MALRLASLFRDRAVLQRDLPIPVWGCAEPGETVTVALAGRRARVPADAEGRWLLRLPPLPAGGPFELVAEAPSGRAAARDVLVGEVWLCSGQSNMAFRLSESRPFDAEARVPLPDVRLLTVSNPARFGRRTEVEGEWAAADGAALAAFSAVGAWFGRRLHAELGVPVGLICNAWPGTRVEAWISREGLVRTPHGRAEVARFEETAHADPADLPTVERYADWADWERRGAPRDAGNRGLAEGWAEAALADTAWPAMELPAAWQERGHPGSGVFWFRKTVVVPAAWIGRDLELRLGSIDKHDDTWVNGERVGGLSWEDGPETWNTPRVYLVPARLVGADGRVAIAVRARSHVNHGGLRGPAAAMQLAPAGDGDGAALPLSGAWRYAVEQDWGIVAPPPPVYGQDQPNTPGILFDNRIAPLVPYGLRGVIWYQGEGNAEDASSYRASMVALLDDWRRAWGQGDFPFLQVQLANFLEASPDPCQGRSRWAELREAQAAVLAEPHAGMAVAIDVGEAGDVHPRDKKTVGLRLARWALAATYGRGGLPSGPLHDSHAAEAGGRVRLRFRHADGLRTTDGAPVRRVDLAGDDGRFVWAETAIEGETLVAWHPSIPLPRTVRYAWADNPEGCNLTNAAGLPASPFRVQI
ncbi:MAG TPA: sialate O-acetylesterase [Candidatus Methylacidiphilales bacterium]